MLRSKHLGKLTVAAVGCCSIVSSTAAAGDGQLQPDPASPGRSRASLIVNLPELPTTAVLDTLEQQLNIANTLICDATDGQVRIGDVNINVGARGRTAADIWWVNAAVGASSDPGYLGRSGRHLTVYADHFTVASPDVWRRTASSVRGDVLAHELGHLVWGIADEYEAPGIAHEGRGPLYDGATNAYRSSPRRAGFAILDEFGSTLSTPDPEAVHSLMQQLGAQECRRPADANAPFDLEPLYGWSAFPCMTNCDCDATGPGCSGAPGWGFSAAAMAGAVQGYTECAPVAPQMSEFATNTDDVPFDPIAGSGVGCPAPRPATELVVSGVLNPTLTSSCGNGAVGPGEACEGTMNADCADVAAGLSGTASCGASCQWDTSTCPGIATQCAAEDVGTACADVLGLGVTGVLGCHGNGSWDTSACESALAVGGAKALDATGVSWGSGMHEVTTHFSAVGPNEWDMVVRVNKAEYLGAVSTCGNGTLDPYEECELGDEMECGGGDGELILTYAGGTKVCRNCLWDTTACIPGAVTEFCGNGLLEPNLAEVCDTGERHCSLKNPQLTGVIACRRCSEDITGCELQPALDVARYRITFDPASGAVVSVLGAGTTLTLGGNSTDVEANGFGQFAPTGAFKNGAPPLPLTVDFSELRQDAAFVNAQGIIQADVRLRARAGTQLFAGNLVDEPQIPNVVAWFGSTLGNARCDQSWNENTKRFEGTDQTIRYGVDMGNHVPPTGAGTIIAAVEDRNDWALLQEAMTHRSKHVEGAEDLAFAGPGPNLLPTPVTPGDCGTVTLDRSVLPLPTQPAEVVLLLDRGATMGASDELGGEGRSRLAFAAAEAQKYLAEWTADPTQLPKVAIIWYSSFRGEPDAGTIVRVGTVSGESPNRVLEPIQSCLTSVTVPGDPGYCLPGAMSVEAIVAAGLNAEVDDPSWSHAERLTHLVPYGDASNSEDAGYLLERVRSDLLGRPGATQVKRDILIFSDKPTLRGTGTPQGGSGIGLTLQPLAAADAHVGYLLYGPVYEELDPAAQAELDALTRLLEQYAPTHRLLIQDAGTSPTARAMLQYAKGESVSLWPERLFLDQGDSSDTHQFLVENGALELSVAQDNGAYTVDQVNGWEGQFQLIDPHGVVVRESGDGSTLENATFSLARVPLPEKGLWTLINHAPQAPGATEVTYRSVAISNPRAQVHVLPSKSRPTDSTAGFQVEARAFYDGVAVDEGVTVTGKLWRTDAQKSAAEMPLTFERLLDGSGVYAAQVNPLTLPSGGRYAIEVEVAVAEGASWVAGESIGGGRPTPRNTVPAFTRQERAGFYLDSSRNAPLDPLEDCDGNGVANQDEPNGDFDGDGNLDICDPDDDGDGQPDQNDPAPQDPLIPFCGSRPSPRCCDSVFSCAGLNDPVLLADGRARLADGVTLLADDGYGWVYNAGTVETFFGPGANVGPVRSVASVELKENAQVHGDLITAGDVLLAAGAVVESGPPQTFASVSLPGLEDFDVPFPAPGSDQILAPQEARTLQPGSYGFVKVEAGSVLTVYPGIYYATEFHVEPGGTVRLLGAASDPVYIYVASQLHFKGATDDPVGSGRLLVGYFGAGAAHLLAPVGATVVAPFGILNLDAHPDPFVGTFVGKEIWVQANVTVMHEPFLYPWYPLASACTDGLHNGDETDIDCGGACGPCAEGQLCEDNGDCSLGLCVGGVCDTSGNCGNGLLDAGETDIDCGGLACGACSPGQTCVVHEDCASDSCTSGVCDAGCDAASAVALGPPSTPMTVPNDACLMVDELPSWWGVRPMLLQNGSGGSYPTPLEWQSDCTAASGSGTFTGDWQIHTLGPTSNSCPTLIHLQGDGSGTVTLQYYSG